MRLCDALDDKKFDLRIRDRLLAEGKINSSDLDKYLADLGDDSQNFIESNPMQSNTSTEDESSPEVQN